ncbi:MAG: nucleotide exchange factor GrpE [Patescibacteria group bacterium]
METSDAEFVSEEEAESGGEILKRLREKLKKAIEEKQEYLDGWQRSRADFANFKREEAAREAEKEARIKAGLVENLLPALDSFELAFKHTQTKELNLVHKQFLDALRKLGVEPFGIAGEAYNPHLHEALAQKESGENIVSIERSGYKIGEHIIRPAQVII